MKQIWGERIQFQTVFITCSNTKGRECQLVGIHRLKMNLKKSCPHTLRPTFLFIQSLLNTRQAQYTVLAPAIIVLPYYKTATLWVGECIGCHHPPSPFGGFAPICTYSSALYYLECRIQKSTHMSTDGTEESRQTNAYPHTHKKKRVIIRIFQNG